MVIKDKSKIMDKASINRALDRMAHEIMEATKVPEDLILIGIHTRGVYLARRLAEKITKIDNIEPPIGTIDITLYRDDLSTVDFQPVLKSTDISFPIDGKKVVLVDDVLYTGRTIRAAIDQIIDFGRPRRIQLAVLVDRGLRELPIAADFVGKSVPTSQKESIKVYLNEVDNEDFVMIREVTA